MRRVLLALLVCAACKHSTSSSEMSHSETSTTTDTTSSESGATTTTTTVTEAPGETTTTTEEFAPPEKETAAPEEAADGGTGPSRTSPTIRHQGPLVKRTVTVTKSGGETTQSRTEASTQGTAVSETHAAEKADTTAKAQEESKPALSCISLGWLWGLILVSVVFAAWRLLRKV